MLKGRPFEGGTCLLAASQAAVSMVVHLELDGLEASLWPATALGPLSDLSGVGPPSGVSSAKTSSGKSVTDTK